MTDIHPTAIIGENVTLGDGCKIGPHCIIEDDVEIGANTSFMANVYVGSYTRIGSHNTFFPFSTIGLTPQDLKFGGEKSHVIIGDHNMVREHVTIHRGTEHGGGLTTIGSHNLLMVGSHVAHDCQLGSRNIMSHGATLAGHVTIGEDATVGAYSAVHQFCKVGNHAFIGGYTVVTQDAMPFVKTVGNRAKAYGINSLGLERKGFTKETITNLKSAYRILFLRKLRLIEALERLDEEFKDCEQVQYLTQFIRAAERGIVR